MKTVLAMLALVCTGSAHAATPDIPDAAYLTAQRLVAVDGARRINLFCVGAGKPVVILDAGAGGGMFFWRHVQAAVGTFTQVCAYDRAGYGFSDPATRVSDAANTVDDLHRLLHAAGLATPIVYVGHSIAGLYGVLFAASYPGEWAGAVLVDPSFAHQQAAMTASDTPAQHATADAATVKSLADMRGCLALSRNGGLMPPTTKAAKDCVDSTGVPGHPSAALLAETTRQWSLPPSNAAALDEIAGFSGLGDKADVDNAEMDAKPASFGDKPLMILTHESMGPLGPDETPAQRRAVEVAWNAGHDALAKRSSRGSNRMVPGAGHYIQVDKPDAVIDAVRQVVTQLRAEKK